MFHRCPRCGSNHTQPANVVVNGQPLLQCQVCQRMFVSSTYQVSLVDILRTRRRSNLVYSTTSAH
jgi:transposase-like protein